VPRQYLDSRSSLSLVEEDGNGAAWTVQFDGDPTSYLMFTAPGLIQSSVIVMTGCMRWTGSGCVCFALFSLVGGVVGVTLHVGLDG
jgi:hypothetical protein